MSQLESHENKVVGVESAEKTVLERRLREADVRVERSASVEEGEKACYNHDNQRLPTEIRGNYTVFGGAGLVLLDVDIPKEDLPEWAQDLPSTFVVESPHGGYHVYYIVEDDSGISNRHGVPWGSIRYGEYVVGPGSEIDHGECDDGKAKCPGEGTGEYEIAVNKPIATLEDQDLEHLREACSSSGGHETSKEEYGGEQIDLPDDTLADEGERYICTEFTRHSTQLAGEDLMDLLRGGTGSYELRRDDETGIDQSAADYYALELLYGAFLYRGEDEEDARRLALAVFKRYCRENPYDKTGNPRKWLRKGERYLQEQMDAAQEEFDFGKWHRWRRRQYENGFNAEEHKPWTDPEKDGKPSITELDIIRAATRLLASPVTPEQVAEQYGLDLSSLPPTYCGEINTPLRSWSSGDYEGTPTAGDIADLSYQLNPHREKSYHDWVLKKWLQAEYGEVAMAFCPSRANSERYVYYPSDLPDPEDARWVRCDGEERDPEPPKEAPEQEVMTDGGFPESETSDVLSCPIDGCSKVFIEEGALRNHASQSRDDDHRGMTLDDSLEPVEKHKVEEILREQYVERGKTLKELEEEWNTPRGTIHYWLKQYDIERRQPVATRVERATYYTDVEGYEKASSYIPSEGEVARVRIHQLLACLSHEPEEVFSPEKHVHHRSEIPWLNIPKNLEVVSREEHQRAHREGEWVEEDGFPVLAVQQVEEAPRWGPGTRSDGEESVYAEETPRWGPGVPVRSA